MMVIGNMPTSVVPARIGDRTKSTTITWMINTPDLIAIETFVERTSYTTPVSALSLDRRSPVRFFSKNSISLLMMEA
jgi:hypothetical protein